MWISLAVMLADSIISLGVVTFGPIRDAFGYLLGRRGYQAVDRTGTATSARASRSRRIHGSRTTRRRERYATPEAGEADDAQPDFDVPPHHLVSTEVVVMGLILSGLLCVTTVSIVFDEMPLYSIIIAFVLALMLSVMGVRALGQTDLNPVSGISKLTQLIFALVVPATNPNAVMINLVAGAVSEAGAQQAGDIMQDLKTGHLIGAAPRAQFYGQLIGSAVGAIASAAVYKLYNSVYTIPSKLFPVPTAYIWIDCRYFSAFLRDLSSFFFGFFDIFFLLTA